VRYDLRRGVEVDDRLRTANSRVYAVGDVVGPLRFTHLADAHARMVVRNALFFGRAKASGLVVPWCTYTSPELAHVGLPYSELLARGEELDSISIPNAGVDRARVEGDTDGFLKVHFKAGSDRIVGATLVGAHAGEIIGQLALAMSQGMGLRVFGETIYPYPTRSEILRKAADGVRRRKLTKWARRVLGVLLRLGR
jgi:pyruvate/2-oxoglutarate dehydrogenase complex dihydrolipoamide dehydrogenase (E3) component